MSRDKNNTLRFVENFLASSMVIVAVHFLKYREDPGNEVGWQSDIPVVPSALAFPACLGPDNEAGEGLRTRLPSVSWISQHSNPTDLLTMIFNGR